MRSPDRTSLCASPFDGPSVARFAGVVLAAGSSRRMGSPKALLPFGDRPLICRVVQNLHDAGVRRVLVVTGHEPDSIRAALASSATEIVHNPDHASGGMVSSIKVGVGRVAGGCEAFFLALGDQPLVNPATLRQMMTVAIEHPGADFFLPTCGSRHGHPILVRSRRIPDIMSLPADATLRAFVKRDDVTRVEVLVDDPAVLMDVDTPEQYRQALELWHNRAAAFTVEAGAATARRSSACPPDDDPTSASHAGKIVPAPLAD